MLKKSAKFLVSSHYKKIDIQFNHSYNVNEFNIKWSRQFRTTDSINFQGSTVWNETGTDEIGSCLGQAIYRYTCKPCLKVTLHKNKKGAFEKKLYKYSLESIGYDQKVKTFASAEIDLSEYADLSGSEHNIAIQLEPKKKYVLKAVIYLSLSFEFIRSGSSKDDDMISTWSRESLDLDAFKPDDLDDSGEVMDLSVNSLVHKMKELSSDVVVRESNFFENLTNCQLIVIICNAEFTHLSPELIATTNNFYSKVKAKFGDTVELFYLSFDKDEEAFTTALNTHKLRCPAIKPFSKLHSTLSQNYDITKVPYLIVLSQDKLVGCASNFSSISAHLDNKNAERRVEKWLGNKRVLKIASAPNLSTFSSPSEDSAEHAETLPSEELENKILCLREKNLSRKSRISQYMGKEVELNKRVSILQAETNLKTRLMKRGQGFKGKIWRMREFQYEDGKIIYIDAKKNEVKGHINISKILSFDLVPKDDQDKNEASFNIVTSDRVYEMQARDYEHMTTWINAAAILQNSLSFINEH